LIHEEKYIRRLEKILPEDSEEDFIDGDTYWTKHTPKAAKLSA